MSMCSKSRTKHRPHSVTFLLSTSSDTRTHEEVISVCSASYIKRQRDILHLDYLMHIALTAFTFYFAFGRCLAGVLEHNYILFCSTWCPISYLLTSKHHRKSNKNTLHVNQMDSFSLNDQFLFWQPKVSPCKTKVCVTLCVCNKVVYNKIKSASSQVACLDFAQLIQKHSPYGKLIICQMGDAVSQ